MPIKVLVNRISWVGFHIYFRGALPMNDLEKYFTNNKGNYLHKWKHYFDIYDRHFSRFRNQKVHVLEIGVSHGGSLQMWKNYFGQKAKIYGVDINPDCKKLEEEQISIFIGSQEDRLFLRSLKDIIPQLDILIDDGGHSMKQQVATFDELYEHINSNGVYLCEDIHTSYKGKWRRGYKKKGSFVEYSKNFIDYINAWHSKTRKLTVTEFTKTAYSLHYYLGILVIEKKPIEKPVELRTGKLTIQSLPAPITRRLAIAGFHALKRLMRRST